VLTHRGARDVSAAVRELVGVARDAGATLCLDANEATRHGLHGVEHVEVCGVDGLVTGTDLCLVLGGDGTILTAMRQFAGTDVPVFAVNYGEVGFLATMDPDGVRDELQLALRGEFDTIRMPSITIGRPDGSWIAFNDMSVHRRPGKRVADLSYALGADEIGRVRCDGLVVSTPAGSTGYNLANGGPVLAWGVEGYVVSFIAPHSFTARALVVAPGDILRISNASQDEATEIHVDGRPTSELPANQDLTVQFGASHALLAQLPGASFYHRLRDRFGRLAR
jgi:NAD+ kinase